MIRKKYKKKVFLKFEYYDSTSMLFQKLLNFVIINVGEFLSGVAYTLPFAIYPNQVCLKNLQLGLQDKGRAIKGLVVSNNWDLEPMDLLNGLALGCYQPSPEVFIILRF